MGKERTDESREKRTAEAIWLNYFNRYLYEHGTISDSEYKQMTEKIAVHCARDERSQVIG